MGVFIIRHWRPVILFAHWGGGGGGGGTITDNQEAVALGNGRIGPTWDRF